MAKTHLLFYLIVNLVHGNDKMNCKIKFWVLRDDEEDVARVEIRQILGEQRCGAPEQFPRVPHLGNISIAMTDTKKCRNIAKTNTKNTTKIANRNMKTTSKMHVAP